MTDLFKDRAADYDQRPVPQQISEGVTAAMLATVPMGPETRVLDFGAGTGLLCAKIAPHVAHVVAVDISEAMLAADRKNRATFGTGASRAAGPSAWRGTLNTCSVRGPGRNLPPRTRRRRRRTNRRRRDVVQAS